MEKKGTFHGTYKIRSIGTERGIRMPDVATGSYAIYSDDTGVFTLIPMGEKK